MAAETDKVEPTESEQDEEEDVYEVERIIDMRVEEGEVLYRVRWKNYCSDDDTWEPEAHLEDCGEVLLTFKKHLTEVKAKKEAESKKSVKVLPTKSDIFDADSESDSEKEHPSELPVKKKKKKKKIREEEDEEPPPKEKKKKKKKDKRVDELRPLPAPETDEEEDRVPTSPSPPKEKKSETKKRFADSDEDDDEPVPLKKHKKEKAKEAGKHKKDKREEGKKKKAKKERKIETSEDEATAPLEEDPSDGPSESQMDDSGSAQTVTKSGEKTSLDDKFKQKKGKWEVKLQGIKDLMIDKKSKKTDGTQKEASLQKLKSHISKTKEDTAPQSDSSDSSTLHKKAKSKGSESTSGPQKAPSSCSSSSSSSSTAVSTIKVKEDEGTKEEVLGQKDASGSTNLFEKFLLNCEAKDRAPRRPPTHPPAVEKSSSKPTKLTGKIEKFSKPAKESPTQKPDHDKTERTKQQEATRPGHSYGFSLDSDEREEECTGKARPTEDFRERKERPEDVQHPSWEKKISADDRRKRREDSEPRLYVACEENQEPPEGSDKSDKSQATLSLGMDLNLDWMTLDDFQKHLNGEDEILSGPPLSPSELRDAVKSGDYMAVKLALNSKEDYNLEQEIMNLTESELDQVATLLGSSNLDCQSLSQNASHLEEVGKQLLKMDQAPLSNPPSIPKDGTRQKQSLKRRPWSEKEQAAVKYYLSDFISNMKVPGKKECNACIAAEPDLGGRSWTDVKNYVHNTLQTIRRRNNQQKSDGNESVLKPKSSKAAVETKNTTTEDTSVVCTMTTVNPDHLQECFMSMSSPTNMSGSSPYLQEITKSYTSLASASTDMLYTSQPLISSFTALNATDTQVVPTFTPHNTTNTLMSHLYTSENNQNLPMPSFYTPNATSMFPPSVYSPQDTISSPMISSFTNFNAPCTTMVPTYTQLNTLSAPMVSAFSTLNDRIRPVMSPFTSLDQSNASSYQTSPPRAPTTAQVVPSCHGHSVSENTHVAQESTPVPSAGKQATQGVKPQKRSKRLWSDEEQAAVRRQFGEFCKLVKVPGKKECDTCLASEPVLSTRTWREVKYFVHNSIQSLKRRGQTDASKQSIPPEAEIQTSNTEWDGPVYLSL